MTEWRLVPEGVVPEWTTPAWYAQVVNTPMADQTDHGPRVQAAADMVSALAVEVAARTVVDVGAGDGGLLQRLHLPDGCKAWGYDLQPDSIKYAREHRPGVDVRYGDVLQPGTVSWGMPPTIVVCTEMLEHLLDPRAFLRRIDPSVEYGVFSSPYLETGDNHYEYHVWAWDLDGYRALLADCGWTVTDQVTVSPMFQVVSARRM